VASFQRSISRSCGAPCYADCALTGDSIRRLCSRLRQYDDCHYSSYRPNGLQNSHKAKHNTVVTSLLERLHIRWGRVTLAALLSEVMVVAVLSAIIVGYRYLVAPGRTAADYRAFTARASYYVAPVTAGLATFLAALWAGHGLTTGFVANGILVGAIAVVLTLGFFFSAKPEDRPMYGVSFALRIIGGYLGGVVAQRAMGA